MTRIDAEKAVRERWERLGLNPETAPHVFSSDIENMLDLGDECQHYEHFNSRENRYICPDKIQAAYRKQIGETGRSVPQYSDPAGGE